MTKILFPECTLETPVIDGVEVVRFDPKKPVPEEHRDASGLVVWEMGPHRTRKVAEQLPDLEFVQLLTAGVDLVPQMGLPDGVLVAGGRSLHDQPVAEHALALMLAGVRGLNTLVRAQIGHRWATEWDAAGQNLGGKLISLNGANVLIWGYGSIGRQLAQYLRALGANVRGVASTAREENGEQVYGPDDLYGLLPETDILVMILPAQDDTRDALNMDVLEQLPTHSWVVNVGRGATVDEEDLEVALRTGLISGAALDVMQMEPLPVKSPLWDLPNVILTPHNAGGRPVGYEQFLAENIAAWQAERPLKNQVETAAANPASSVLGG